MNIFILHPGKANYPEIIAYKDFFTRLGHSVTAGTSADLSSYAGIENCVLWCIMGFYSKLPRAKIIIHDYRSLSVGRFAALKDCTKRLLNVRPTLRIFQNERMRAAIGFRDGVPYELLPMGVPEWIFSDFTSTVASASHTFCYIGEMSVERKFDRVLTSFIENPWLNDCSLALVGHPQDSIYHEFKGARGISFVGKKSQREALSVVRASQFAICYFPSHRPHCFQTPTKLLEYAALGSKILCNDSPSNLATIGEMEISAFVAGKYVFDGLSDNLWHQQVRANDRDLMRDLSWNRVIQNSNVLHHLRKRRTSLIM